MDYVMTVQGPVAPADIGATLTHEHIFWDGSVSWDPDSSDLPDPSLATARMEPSLAGLARWNGRAIKDNLVQAPDEYEMIAEEVSEAAAAGVSCIVDLTNVGLNPAPELLKRLSTELRLNIVAGCGFYVHRSHPEWLERAEEDEITSVIVKEIREGIGETGIRPGIIGEIGTSEPLFPCEERVLRAAGRAAAETGLAINVHADPQRLPLESAMKLIEILDRQGHDTSRTVIHNLDQLSDVEVLSAVLGTGVTLGFESYGCEGFVTPTFQLKNDLERMQMMVALLERGFEDQIVVSHDTGLKYMLHRFGGMGYDHVIRRIMPRLVKYFGVTDGIVEKLLIHTPRRLLTITEHS